MHPFLLLFDIDGTLITGKGVPKKIMIDVLRNYFPHFAKGEEVPFSGMTDPQIIYELMRANDYTIKAQDPIVNRILSDFYPSLSSEFQNGKKPQVLSGVNRLLDQCSSISNCFMGLVTGNSMDGARIKLQSVNLYHFFPGGAFGSDDADRNNLPPIAVKRLSEYHNKVFSKKNVWIIGDSVFDVRCAKNNDLKCLAVETGKTDLDDLIKSGADIVLKDLSDANKVLKIIGL